MSSSADSSPARVTLLGPKSQMKGDLVTEEELVLLGQLHGDKVQSPNITIGPAARVRASIRTGRIRIEGTVIGDIHADHSVIVHASATVRGAIHSPSITIREGANVNGSANVDVAHEHRRHDSARQAAARVRNGKVSS
ncbi:MAG: polymer-forming cytoskeletal protein [Steroidobacteraceae bacterium]